METHFNQEDFNNFVLDNDILGFFEEPITLASGRTSQWYFNWRKPTSDPFLIEKVAQFIINYAKDKNLNPNCFYGVPDGATKLGIITQYLWSKKSIDFGKGSHSLSMGRKVPKEHGSLNDRFFIGAPEKRVIVIEDVTTTGGALIKGIQQLQESGVEVVAAFSLTDRMVKRDSGESVKEAVEKLNVPFYNLSNALDLLPILIKKSNPSDSVINSIKEEFERYGIQKIELDNIQNTTILTEKEELARKKVCLPLDGLNSIEEVKQRVKELSPYVGLFKIGKESYTRFGPKVVKLIQENGSEVFLDLKYHDIPNTVKGAVKAAAELGVYMVNVHSVGGLAMMRAAIEGAHEGSLNGKIPKIIAVTVLTSIDQQSLNQDLNIPSTVADRVLHLAKLTQQAGLNGIVCSAADLAVIKHHLPEDFMYITPAIKGPNTPAGIDQKRVFTPSNAIEDGSTILVIGRAITAHSTAAERIKAAREVLQDMANNLQN